jgi:hypothetical protein
MSISGLSNCYRSPSLPETKHSITEVAKFETFHFKALP